MTDKPKYWKLELDNSDAYILKNIMETIIKAVPDGASIIAGRDDMKLAEHIVSMLGEVPLPKFISPINFNVELSDEK